MPGVTAGVYTGALTAGTEVSSTYEGRHLTVLESELIHPYIADGFVNKGDPVCLCDAGVQTTYGAAVGVAFNSATAASDYIAIDTEGVWNLTVYAENDDGNVAVEIGDQLYIRAGNLPGAADGDGTGDAEISKIRTTLTQVPFGYALGSMVAGGSGVIAVKVHWDPINDPIEIEQLGEGWSLNLIDVVSTATIGEGTRGLRVNMTSDDDIVSGDMQCLHGYMTLGTTPALAVGAAIGPLSGWIDIPNDTSLATGNIVAVVRAIFDPNNNDMEVGGGNETALFYGQTWNSTGHISHGLAVIAGTGTTIRNGLHFGGAGAISNVIDLTEYAADEMSLVAGGPNDGAGAVWRFWVGEETDHAGIQAITGGASNGSIYASHTTGQLFVKMAGTWTAQA